MQIVAEEKKDVTSVNAQQSFSNTELRIASNSNKFGYLTSWIATLGCM